jgi:hypothetical protein
MAVFTHLVVALGRAQQPAFNERRFSLPAHCTMIYFLCSIGLEFFAKADAF